MIETAKQINLFTRRASGVAHTRTPETEIQAAFFAWVKLHENRFPELKFCFHVPNGGYRFKATAAAMKRAGTRAGVPDVSLPVARKGYHGLWIEFKSDAGKLSEAQETFIEFLRRQNYCVLVCRSWMEAASAVVDYLGLSIGFVKDSSSVREIV